MFLVPKSALFSLAGGIANQMLHQAPDSLEVLLEDFAGTGGLSLYT